MKELNEYKAKLGTLEALMNEQGIDADALFKEAGLDIKDDNSARSDGPGSRVFQEEQRQQAEEQPHTGGAPPEKHGNTSLVEQSRDAPVDSGVSSSASTRRSSDGARKLEPVVEALHEESKASEVEPSSSSLHGKMVPNDGS